MEYDLNFWKWKMTSIFLKIEDDLNFLKMEENLIFIMEDNLNLLNGRRPQKNITAKNY
jgi:hypothetical protein